MTEHADNTNSFPLIMISLFKGVIYADDNPPLWQNLLTLQPRIADYAGAIGLELIVQEDEGFAWLQSKTALDGIELPKLIAKRELSYPVSLLLALLRRKLTEHDAHSGDQRLILGRDEIIDMTRTFFSSGSNETKIVDQIDSYINKVIELGFVRRLRGESGKFEVRRILKAFVDVQWLDEFDLRLKEYLSTSVHNNSEGIDE